MPPKSRAANRDSDLSPKQPWRSPRQTQRSPNLLYPDLPLEDSNDENDDSWTMPSPGDLTQSSFMTSSDQYESSFLGDSPSSLGRSPLHGSYSPRMTRLRSGKSYGAESFSDNSDDYESPRRRQTAQTRNRAAEGEKKNNFGWLLIVIFLVAGLVGIYMFLPRDKTASASQPKVYEQFKLRMSDLRGKFLAQSTRSWKTLHVATKHILEDPHPVNPAVVLMVGMGTALPTMSCIGTQMVTLLNQLYNVSQEGSGETKILATELNRNTPAQEKKDLDEKLHRAFTSGNKGAILVNMERLSPEAILMLHSYCDNDNSPFTNILLVLQLVTDKLRPEELDNQQAVEGFMLSLWEKELGVDRVMALFSRIANNIIAVNAEETATLSVVCGSGGWF